MRGHRVKTTAAALVALAAAGCASTATPRVGYGGPPPLFEYQDGYVEDRSPHGPLPAWAYEPAIVGSKRYYWIPGSPEWYTFTGPQGPAGRAGPAGPQGPRGLAGAARSDRIPGTPPPRRRSSRRSRPPARAFPTREAASWPWDSFPPTSRATSRAHAKPAGSRGDQALVVGSGYRCGSEPVAMLTRSAM